jgi:hypothetical protein
MATVSLVRSETDHLEGLKDPRQWEEGRHYVAVVSDLPDPDKLDALGGRMSREKP